jgi:hypothetical protein
MRTKKHLNKDTLYVEVDYRKGGVTLVGEHKSSAYVLYIQPCEVTNGIVSVCFSKGRSVTLAEVGRRNVKKHAAL